MSQKQFLIPDIGTVIIQKRRGNKNLRLSISRDGKVKVTMPTWAPYQSGIVFVRSKIDWIKTHQTTRIQHIFTQNERIGKAHRLVFLHEPRKTCSSRVTNQQITVKLPQDMDISDDLAQKQVYKSAVRALKHEANTLLPDRVRELAHKNGFEYNSVSIKLLKSRWGSCSSHKDIALNCFLMQLPWDLIDYVILHELLHTQIMAHGKVFWTELAKYTNNLPAKRKMMRKHQPLLRPQI